MVTTEEKYHDKYLPRLYNNHRAFFYAMEFYAVHSGDDITFLVIFILF